MRDLDPALYTVVWIAPLEIEARAALHAFDEVHDGKFCIAAGQDYPFRGGRVGEHNVVLATLRKDQPYGTGSAAAIAAQVKMTFPNLRFGLLVGVAAGLPNLSSSTPRDIRLGDVLVALPEGDRPGIIAYDLGKQVAVNEFELLYGGNALAKTESTVLTAVSQLKAQGEMSMTSFKFHCQAIQQYKDAEGIFNDPGQDQDTLFENEIPIPRTQRSEDRRTLVWYGTIGSGEKLMKDATRRNELRDRYDILGLEMEAAGTMNTIPVGVIRGVSDYADCHKNKNWQPYASATAAAYAKLLLSTIKPLQLQGWFRFYCMRFQNVFLSLSEFAL